MGKLSLKSAKWIFSSIIWVTTLIGNSLPMCIKAPSWTARAESLAGGVFLGAGLAHLLADAVEELEKYTYPVGPAVALGMFVILTLVELFSYTEHDANAFGDHNHDHDHTQEHHPIHNYDISDSSMSSIANHDHTVSLFGKSNSLMNISTISLYIIMDIHSAIEGLALGILNTWSGIIAIFCAIVGHKPVEAFALSLILLKDHPTKFLFWLLVLIYTLLTPIGLITAIYIGEISSDAVKGIIASLSSGTFIFVGSHEWSEMLHQKHEWSTKEKWWHFGMFTFGVVWMLLIAIVEALSPEH